MPLLFAQNISFTREQQTLLHAIDLSLESGEILGIIGPNGAGKSTLLKILAGYHPPNTGQIQLAGQHLNRYSARELACLLAVVNPRETLPNFPMLTSEYITLGRTPHQDWLGRMRPLDRQILEEIMTTCKITPFAEQPLSQLSSGEWQRTQLARALAQEPRLLLLDEPLSHLDISAQLEVMALLQTIAQKGTGIIIVLHDLNLAARFAMRLLLLHQGQLISQGTPREVLSTSHLHSVYGPHWQISLSEEYPVILPVLQRPTSPPEIGI